MMVRNFLRICHTASIWLLAAAAATATATERSVSADIDKYMTSYTHSLAKRLGSGAHIDYSTSGIAANATSQSCATPLAISARDQTQTLNRVTLLVACGNDWSMYVPIDLDVHLPIVITNKPLANGAVIGADDVELSSFDVSDLTGTYLTTLDDAIGMGVKRSIAPGRPVLSQQLEQPLIIHRGDAVVINAEAGMLAVKMTGTALNDGRRGEQIRIKNQATSRVVDARVTGPGEVAVSM
jgi:flagella basal body P-ring formation protein FlgA